MNSLPVSHVPLTPASSATFVMASWGGSRACCGAWGKKFSESVLLHQFWGVGVTVFVAVLLSLLENYSRSIEYFYSPCAILELLQNHSCDSEMTKIDALCYRCVHEIRNVRSNCNICWQCWLVLNQRTADQVAH